MKNSDWKDRLNVVYSTNPDYNYGALDDDEEQVTLEPSQQNLRVQLEFGETGRGKVRNPNYRLCPHRERPERFGKTPQDEMWSRRIWLERRRDYRSGRLQTKNSRTAEERRVHRKQKQSGGVRGNKSHLKQVRQNVNKFRMPFTLYAKVLVPDSA